MLPLLLYAMALLAEETAPPSVSVSNQNTVSKPVPPDSEAALRTLCRGKDLCWLVVVTPPQGGAFIVQAKFPPAKRLIRPEDAYCDRREYWHVSGSAHTLLGLDCAEQWGPDSQGPVRMSIEAGRIKLTYLEWEYDNNCEKTVALLDFETAKLISLKRWAGVGSPDRKDCRRLSPLKSLPPGDGKTTPLVPFNSDSVSNGQEGK